jgi:DNA polymerase
MNSVKYINGEGNYLADVIFVGEAPSTEEVKQGRPFVGQSGKALRAWITEYLDQDPAQFYITNIVKVKLEDNRSPTEEELTSWYPVLAEEISSIPSDVIVTVGASATKALLQDKYTSLKEQRGQFIEITTDRACYTVMPIYHPAYIRINPDLQETIKQDLTKLKDYLWP